MCPSPRSPSAGPTGSWRLLAIDDEPDITDYICWVAQGLGLGIDASKLTQSQEVRRLSGPPPDLIMLDLYMPEMDGVEVLRFFGDLATPPAGIVLMTGGDTVLLRSAQDLARELGLNVIAVLPKPLHRADLEAVLHRAYENLTGSQRKERQRTLPTEDECLAAVENDAIDVYFQPQMFCADQALVGVEALARWIHPRAGEVPATEFIRLAENTRCIQALDLQVFRKALEWMQTFRKERPDLRLSINLSTLSLLDLDLPERLTEMAARGEAEPQSITIEVTETSAVQQWQRSLDVLIRLSMRGFCLAIDDFGTGYSSMAQLVRIPFRELKIDKRFVTGLEGSNEYQAVVRASITLARELGLNTVAEGVESDATFQLLAMMGCDIAQGNLFDAPMPAGDLAVKLTTREFR